MKKKGKNNHTCHFCKKDVHFKKDCLKYKKWIEKKGNLIFVYHESNFTKISSNTWWIGSGSRIHIVKTVQRFLNLRKLMRSEQDIYSGNIMHS